MKKFIICFAILLIFQSADFSPLKYEELNSIMQMTDEMGMELDAWELVAIDTVSDEKQERITEWLHTVSELSVDDEHGRSFVISNTGYINVTIQFIKTKEVKIQVVISGEEWKEHTQVELNRIWGELEQVIFTKTTNLYTCAKLVDNGIIIDGIYTDNIQKILGVDPIFNQMDNIKDTSYEVEYYGYAPSWKSEINVNNEKINFQMAVKSHLKNDKLIIIGTPAILNEY